MPRRISFDQYFNEINDARASLVSGISALSISTPQGAIAGRLVLFLAARPAVETDGGDRAARWNGKLCRSARAVCLSRSCIYNRGLPRLTMRDEAKRRAHRYRHRETRSYIISLRERGVEFRDVSRAAVLHRHVSHRWKSTVERSR